MLPGRGSNARWAAASTSEAFEIAAEDGSAISKPNAIRVIDPSIAMYLVEQALHSTGVSFATEPDVTSV
jgi:hypothetical protein